MSENFSSDELPQVLYVATPERSISYQWSKDSDSIDSQVKVASLEQIRDYKAILPKRIAVGDVLMLHPFEENLYINVNDVGNIRNAKFFAYSEIAQQLGATEYKIVYGNRETSEAEFSTKNKLKWRKKRGGKLDMNDKKQASLILGFNMSGTYEGVPVISDESYKKAKEVVRKYNLETDTMIKSLINKRNPQNENHQHSEKIHCELTKEINRILDIAITINASNMLKLDSHTQETTKKREIVNLDIEFYFP